MQVEWPSSQSLKDARIWQIGALATLLAVGIWRLGFGQDVTNVAAILGAALLAQAILSRAFELQRFDPLSPIITALSLCILLRANGPQLLAVVAAAAMAAKFLIRVNGKHIFNPANFAIVVALATGEAWISPSQWGTAAWSAFLFASLAILVLSRAKRAEIALAFLIAFAGLALARALYLGDPLAIPVKQLQSGAVLLFAFFMISDPKTTPDKRTARIVYAVLVASLAHYLIFWRYIPEGMMYALFVLSPLVPLFDRFEPTPEEHRFSWARPTV